MCCCFLPVFLSPVRSFEPFTFIATGKKKRQSHTLHNLFENVISLQFPDHYENDNMLQVTSCRSYQLIGKTADLLISTQIYSIWYLNPVFPVHKVPCLSLFVQLSSDHLWQAVSNTKLQVSTTNRPKPIWGGFALPLHKGMWRKGATRGLNLRIQVTR